MVPLGMWPVVSTPRDPHTVVSISSPRSTIVVFNPQQHADTPRSLRWRRVGARSETPAPPSLPASGSRIGLRGRFAFARRGTPTDGCDSRSRSPTGPGQVSEHEPLRWPGGEYGQYFARLVTPPPLSASTTIVVGVSIRRSPNWDCWDPTSASRPAETGFPRPSRSSSDAGQVGQSIAQPGQDERLVRYAFGHRITSVNEPERTPGSAGNSGHAPGPTR